MAPRDSLSKKIETPRLVYRKVETPRQRIAQKIRLGDAYNCSNSAKILRDPHLTKDRLPTLFQRCLLNHQTAEKDNSVLRK